MVRLHSDQMSFLDDWIEQQNETDLSRPEAIRRLVELGLTVKPKARPRVDSQKQRAQDSAGKAVDKMADAGATADDQAGRKRRLLKGPEEFRDARVDLKRK